MKLLPNIDPVNETVKIVKFLRRTMQTRGFRRATIAISGGVDSATALMLCTKAIRKNLVYPLLMPYGDLNNQAAQDAQLVVQVAGVNQKNIELVDIAPLVQLFLKKLEIDQKQENNKVRIGNIMARCRMIILYDRAKKYRALVIGTENKSEHQLSYFTRFGDEAADIEPIKHLYKTQVIQLAKYLKVPESIIAKSPTAGLWSGQTDEGEFGFSYETADQILYGLYDLKLPDTELVKKGFTISDIDKVKNWADNNHFKHELPIVLKSKF